MQIDEKIVHIAIAFDQNYLDPFEVLLSSLLINNGNHVCHLHLIAPDLSQERKGAIIRRIKDQKWSVIFYEFSDVRLNQFTLGTSWTKAAYYRLYFPLLISEEVTKLIYLDTDTLVVGDIMKLYSIDMGNYPLAAVYDNYVKTQPLIGITHEGEYFNSGVLLIDLKKWRTQGISELVFEYLLKFPERIRFVDQCGLNAVLKDNWKCLDPKFNLLYTYVPNEATKREIKKFIKDKIIVHFTLQRPWNMLCKSRLRFLYFDYLKLSGTRNHIYTDFSYKKIPVWIMIRLKEMYFDAPQTQFIWRALKQIF